ncbi:MAG: sugar phosphate isomerase/epimerase [Burkholderiaceae bacterium]|nr:sugar phosphate isomerase/epimerase [Burkholderiaceae bacterium]
MKLSLCNEVLQHLPFEDQCRIAAALGCQGLEVAPFTLTDDPRTLTDADGRRLAGIAADHGLTISSLHWLLVKPDGLSLSTPDDTLHARTVGFLRHLVDFAAACGAQAMVHGSHKQRSPWPGQSVADALARAEHGWAQLAPAAEAAGVVYCIEPLSRRETEVLNTVAEAAAVVDRIGSPALRTMIDLSAAAQAEAEPPHQVLARYLASGHIAHVQVNDANRRGPGQGDTPVAPLLRVLHQAGYGGWIAMEPFDYHPDPLACAAHSAGYVRGILETLR